MNIKIAHIVICHMVESGDFTYHIDSVWTSKRKAEKRVKDLNSEDKSDWREEYGYGLFDVENKFISK